MDFGVVSPGGGWGIVRSRTDGNDNGDCPTITRGGTRCSWYNACGKTQEKTKIKDSVTRKYMINSKHDKTV